MSELLRECVWNIRASRDRRQATAKVFRDAIDYIGQNGWFQGDWFEKPESISWEDFTNNATPFPEGCRVCALGSLAVVTSQSLHKAFDNNAYNDAEMILLNTIRENGFLGINNVAEWNDDPDTTLNDVLETFTDIAEDLEADE